MKSENWVSFISVLLYALSCLIFAEPIRGPIFLAIGLGVWLLVYRQARKNHSVVFSLLTAIMLSVPLAFTDIFGQLRGGTIFSWFYILIIILALHLVLYGLQRTRIKLTSISMFAFLTAFVSTIPLLAAKDRADGLKQYINIFIVLISPVIGNLAKDRLTGHEKMKLRHTFVRGAIIAGIGVFAQFIMFSLLGKRLGYFKALGSFRNAFGYLFLDFSFLSLYLSAGGMLAFTLRQYHRENRLKYSIVTILLLVASLITSARTGFAAFIAVFVLYTGFYFLRLMPVMPIRSALLVMANTVILLGGYRVLLYFRPAGFRSDSGRGILNARAFDIFKNSPFTGIGFGSSTYGGTIPHNLIYQSLAQGGLLFTIPICLFFAIILLSSFKRNKDLFFVLLTVLIGSMFIPNIFNSRFLSAILILFGLGI